MDTLVHHPSPVTIAMTRIALAWLLVAVVVGQIIAAISANSVAKTYPEFAELQLPLVAAVISFGICVQIVLVVIGIFVGYTSDARIFEPRALKLVDVMVGTLALATIIVAATLFFIPGPPALGLLLAGGTLGGVTITLVLLVLRSLLRRTASMRVELDEVV